jgi:hypothetical protein
MGRVEPVAPGVFALEQSVAGGKYGLVVGRRCHLGDTATRLAQELSGP